MKLESKIEEFEKEFERVGREIDEASVRIDKQRAQFEKEFNEINNRIKSGCADSQSRSNDEPVDVEATVVDSVLNNKQLGSTIGKLIEMAPVQDCGIFEEK
jgi:hypothetical protein